MENAVDYKQGVDWLLGEKTDEVTISWVNQPGVRAKVQKGRCTSDTCAATTPGTGAEVIDSPAVSVRQLPDRR